MMMAGAANAMPATALIETVLGTRGVEYSLIVDAEGVLVAGDFVEYAACYCDYPVGG